MQLGAQARHISDVGVTLVGGTMPEASPEIGAIGLQSEQDTVDRAKHSECAPEWH